MSSSAPLVAFGGGIVAHLGFFNRGEHFLYPLRYVQSSIFATAAGTALQMHYGGQSPGLAVSNTVGLLVRFFLGLFFSLLTYRTFANPLNKFPGPFMARYTKFDTSIRFRKMDSHLQLQKLHKKYGKFVRIGPSDLSVVDADGTQVISAPNSKCYKSTWYAHDVPLVSMHTTRDRALHDRRRRVWSPAFSDRALRGYEERVQAFNDMLATKLEELKGQPANASTWFNLYSYDVMGDLGFGNAFDMLHSGKKHWAITLLGLGMDPLAFSFPSWFFRLLVSIPALAAGYHKFIAYCCERLDDRIKVHAKTDPNKPDITSFLIDQYLQADNKRELLPMLQGDVRLIIVAGSDTTAAALTHLFYWLAKKPELQAKLRKEMNGQITNGELQNNQYMQGLIDETLRLNPPVPSGVFRTTPPEGVHIGNTFVPGSTQIQMPTYVMGHDEDNYEKAEECIPERWYEKTDMVKHKDAWGPFSSGPFGCIGKNLAYMEIRTVTANIVSKFDISFAKGEDGTALLTKTKDHFTLELADLELVFQKRV